MNEEEVMTPPDEENGSQERPAEKEPELVPIERYKNAQARMTQATQEAAQLRRELAAMQSQMNVPNQSHPTTDADEEELRNWMKEYPDFAGPIVKKLDRQQQILRQLEQQNSMLRSQNEAVQRDSFRQIVTAAHPDVNDIVNSDDFKGWLNRQPSGISKMAHEGSADDLNYVLKQYKQSLNQPNSKLDDARRVAPPSVKNAQAGAANAAGTGLKSFTREQIKAMTPQEFDANEAAIDAAMAAGLVS